MLGTKVLVRDHRAGVHVGTLTSWDTQTKCATLKEARKVWYWAGAASVHGIAARGIDQKRSQIAPVVPEVISCDVIEIVACTDEGYNSVMTCPEWKP